MKNIGSFDIIIPTYKPGDKFIRLFEMLQKQELRYNRLILINTERSLMGDAIRELVCSDERTLLKDISADQFDHAATRAMAVGLSEADAFICMTDDAVPDDARLTAELMDGLREDRTAVCYARQLAAEDADEAERFVRVFNYPDQSIRKGRDDIGRLGIKTFFASDVCCAYDRAVYDSLGGFIDTAIFNEDMIYAAAAVRNGYTVFYNAAARVIHSHNYTAVQQLHRNFDLGVSQSMHPEVFAGLSSEGEGIKLVKSVISHLASSGHAADIPVFAVRTAFRYAGYKAGRMYDKLPDACIRSLAMNKRYAEKLISERIRERKQTR